MKIEQRLDRIESMLLRILQKVEYPASTLPIHEKAAAIRKALATGDKKILRQTMKEINGE